MQPPELPPASALPMARPRPQPGTAQRRIAPLDPCTLGRPFHLLDDYLRRLVAHLDRLLQQRFNRRCDAAFHPGAAHVAAFLAGTGEGAIWRGYRDDTGAVAVRIDRPLLLAMLDFHYGEATRAGSGHADEVPETETEHRFASALHLQFLDALSLCASGAAGRFAADPVALPRAGHRIVRIELREQTLGLSGSIEFALDEAWLTRLFDCVVPQRAPSPPSADARVPLQRRLPVRIEAQIASRDLAFEDLLRLRVGDVLPIRPVTSAEVLVEGVRLYRASIAEQGGLLCLTFFEPAE